MYDALIEIASTGAHMAQRIEKELHEQITQLKDYEQLRLLEFARSLANSPGKGAGGRALLRFAGTIERDEIVAMQTAIDDGCEIVNVNEW
jgi:hypothetical protein